MPLPSNCSACAFYQQDGSLCRRHAPGTGYEEMEIARWPKIGQPKIDRCGSGVAVGDGSTSPMECSKCIHWLQPGGKPLSPSWKQDMPDAWWRDSGLCTRFPPSPSSAENRVAKWRVANGRDRCGDGEAIEETPRPEPS